MDAHEVLVEARNHIDRYGWVQVAACEPGAPVCVAGALEAIAGISAACFDYQGYTAARDVLARVLDVGPSAPAIGRWNDNVCRSKAEALAAFDRAIAATSPAPPFASLGQEPATAREPVTEVVA